LKRGRHHGFLAEIRCAHCRYVGVSHTAVFSET
jgi:hypothetical protein